MHNWRLLLLAFLAAIEPIASFTERSLVDGLQECCDRQSHTLLRDSRLLHGTYRYTKSTRDDHGLDQREERRYEVRTPTLARQSSDRLLFDTRESSTRHLTQYSRDKNSFDRINENRERFSSAGDAPKASIRDTTNDIDTKISRERVTREHGRDSFEYYRMSRDERKITRLENGRLSRISRDSRRMARPMQGNSRELRRISSRHNLERDMYDETRTEFSISKPNDRDMATEDNNRERRSLDRRVRENKDVSRRSLSLEAKMSRVSNLREYAGENLREDIRESHDLINLRTNKRSGINRQQRDVNRMQRDRTMSARSSDERKQEHDELSRAIRTSVQPSSFVQNRVLESSKRSRIVNIKGVRENARHSRSTEIENPGLERDSRDFRHVSNERFIKNRLAIRDTKTRSTSVRSEGKERFSNNLLERANERHAQESSRVDKERFTRNRQNTRVERWSAGVTEKENRQFSENRHEIMSEDRRSRQNNARILRKREAIRSVERNPPVSREENGDRLAIIRQDIRRDERLSAAVTRPQNEQFSQNPQEVKYEETHSRRDITSFIDKQQNGNGAERSSVIREKNMRSRNRQINNDERRSIEAILKNMDRPTLKHIERRLYREENERFSKYRYGIRTHERRSLMAGQEELSSNRKVERYIERFSRNANRIESEIYSRNRREVSKSEERRSEVDSRDKRGILIHRQEIRNNKRYSRIATREERDVRRDTLRSKERQASRSHDAVVDRSRSGNSRENAQSRSLSQHSAENIGRDISRTRNLMDRELVLELRNSEIDRSREITHAKNLTKMQPEKSIFDVNWQMIMYTLQGIYLCNFLIQMVTDNTKNTTKSRSLGWMAVPSQNLFKLD